MGSTVRVYKMLCRTMHLLSNVEELVRVHSLKYVPYARQVFIERVFLLTAMPWNEKKISK